MKKVLPVFLTLFLLVPLLASAQDVGSGAEPIGVICSILNLIKDIILAIGLGIAVIVLIIGGIQYMTAGGDAEKSNNAKKLIINAIIGIAIVFAAVFILALVQGLLTGAGVTILGDPCPAS